MSSSPVAPVLRPADAAAARYQGVGFGAGQPSPPRVLIVHPDRAIANAVRTVLGEAGAEAQIVPSVESALAELGGRGADLVVLAVDGNSASIGAVRRIRRTGAAIFAIGRRPSTRAACAVLDAGADDWLPAPFHPEEFRARCGALMRRRQMAPARRLVFGPLEIDVDAWTATAAGRPFAFTRSDWIVLGKLARRPGEVVPHAEIGGGEPRNGPAQHALARARIGRLRRRLAMAGVQRDPIRLAEGHGYCLDLTAR